MGYTKTFIKAEKKLKKEDNEDNSLLKISVLEKFNNMEKQKLDVSLFQTAEDLNKKMEMIKKNMEEYLKKSIPPEIEKKVKKKEKLNVFENEHIITNKTVVNEYEIKKQKYKEMALNGELDKIIDEKIKAKMKEKEEKDKRLKKLQNEQKKLLGPNTIKQVKNKLEVQRENIKKKNLNSILIEKTNKI